MPQDIATMLSNPVLRLRQADHDGASARQFFIGNLRNKMQIQAEAAAFPKCHVVEEINYISAESIFDPTAFVKIKGTSRIYF